MNLQERQPLPKLWLHSFAVANQALPKLLVILGLYVILSFIVLSGIRLFATPLSMLLIPFLSGSKLNIIVGGLLLAFAIMFIFQCFNCIFATAGIKVISQTAEQKPNYLLETFFDSLKPAAWMVLANLLISLITIPVAFISHWSALLGGLLNLVLLFLVYIRLIYNQTLIALEGQGPIDSLVNSWQMTGGMRYVDTLLMVIMCAVTGVIYFLASLAVFYILYTQIPLHAAQFFDLSKSVMGWVILGIIVGLVAFFCLCQLVTFWVLTFLNRYYAEGGTPVRPFGEPAPIASLPLPNINLPSDTEQHVEEGLPPDTDHIAKQKQAAQATNGPAPQQDAQTITGMMPLGSKPAAQPQVQAPVTPASSVPPAQNPNPHLDQLGITQSSINTTEEDTNEITQHLKQVYTPSKTDVVQQGDEDRMPTILFDDDMAKQLENSFLKHAAENKQGSTQPNPPQDDGPIKMSK